MATRNSYGWMSPDMQSSAPAQQNSLMDFYMGKGPGATPTGAPGGGSQTQDYMSRVAPAFQPSYGGGAGGILDTWRGQQPGGDPVQMGQKDWTNPSFFANEGNRNLMEGYTNYFAIPYGNLALAQQTQDFNQANAISNFLEQQRVNSGQMELAKQGSQREDTALNFGMQTNQRDFTEGQRQFNEQNALDEMWKRGQLDAQTYANETQRIQTQNQLTLGQESNRNQLIGLNQQYQLGQAANQNQAMDIRNQYALGQGKNANELLNINNQMTLGKGSLANQAFANQAQAARYQGQTANEAFANQTALTLGQGQNANQRFGLENQLALGQGQLGFQNRELDVNNAFNQQQLAQQADLTREGYQRDLTNQRYAAFGRATAPNTRAAQSWY